MDSVTSKPDGFEGYTVPDGIKRIATAICERFIINGICDPMYIANTIAHSNGGGDGVGHFSTAAFEIDALETAKALQGSYGYNIVPGDLPELESIIQSGGGIDPQTACKGLTACVGRLQAEREQTGDQWRKDYLARQIVLATKQAQSYAANLWAAHKPPSIAGQMKEAGEQAAKDNAARPAPEKPDKAKSAER